MNCGPQLERLRLIHAVRRRIAASVFFMGLGVPRQPVFPEGVA